MTADELVEKVARAIWKTAGDDVCAFDTLADPLKDSLREEARAAIRAVHEVMREPSAQIINVGYRAIVDGEDVETTWRAMLSASPLAEAARDD